MSFDDIKTFIVLAQTNSFSRTAEILYTSQSTISTRIKSIETQLGKKLINRSTKNFELTLAGKDFLNYALQLNRLYSESIQAISISGDYTYKLSIGAPESVWDWIIFRSMHNYILSNRDISFMFYCDHSTTLNQMLIDGNLDVAISMIPIQHPNAVYKLLYQSRYVLVSHKDLSLASKHFTRNSINQFPFIQYSLGPAFENWFNEKYYKQSHFIEVEKVALYLYLLQNQCGICFLPSRIAQQYLESGDFIALEYDYEDSAPSEDLYIAYNTQHSTQAKPVVDVIRQYMNDHFISSFFRYSKKIPE